MVKKIDQAVIMVGGMGTRLRPLTETCPKPVLPVLDKPCLMYLIESIAKAGVKEIILACGYRSQQLKDAIGDGSHLGIDISYSYEDEPLGTAGAIKKVVDRLGDTFIAANGDVFADIDVTEEISAHFKSGALATLSLTPVENPWEFGVAGINDDGRITEFREKPEPEDAFSNLINAGIYVLEKKIFDLVPENTKYDLSKELIPLLVKEGEIVQGYKLNGVWLDVGRPHDLIVANLTAADKYFSYEDWSKHDVHNIIISGTFYLGKNSVIRDSSFKSSVVLKNCKISRSKLKGSLIMPNSFIEGSEIENSIIGNNCIISEGSLIYCSVIGDRTHVSVGTKIINNEVRE